MSEITATPMDKKQGFLPAYIVCDTSQSMGESGAIDVVNEGLQGIIQEILRRGEFGDEIRLCIISFATKAKVELPLSKVTMRTEAPRLRAGGTTNLADATTTLADTIIEDFKRMREEGGRFYRPAVFIFTDGVPTNDDGLPLPMSESSTWEEPLKRIKEDNQAVWGPRIFAYGVEDADTEVLRKLVDYRGLDPEKADLRSSFTGGDAARAIGKLFPELFKTLVSGAEAAAEGASEEEIENALDDAHREDVDPRIWWESR